MNAFSEFTLTNGLLYDYTDNTYPTRLHAWKGEQSFLTESSTYYGYVFEGATQLTTPDNQYHLLARQYFCVNQPICVDGGSGIVIERVGYRGMNSVGGPVEKQGRLKYIDGCTDSLLIPPVKLGDPCLNALFFPVSIDQTAHTHPSMRVGMVIDGEGWCVTPEQTYKLVPGMVFIIHEGGAHKFKTGDKAPLTVVAYHPDSDFGPLDENHPMINRTMVEGVSASRIREIQTQ